MFCLYSQFRNFWAVAITFHISYHEASALASRMTSSFSYRNIHTCLVRGNKDSAGDPSDLIPHNRKMFCSTFNSQERLEGKKKQRWKQIPWFPQLISKFIFRQKDDSDGPSHGSNHEIDSVHSGGYATSTCKERLKQAWNHLNASVSLLLCQIDRSGPKGENGFTWDNTAPCRRPSKTANKVFCV